ncbi:L,D-transpeptidase family protein [Sphingomonas sp. PB2P19]|uniref:L,D-transpeptidase family protein n=1 Tax=Sphingomonas rhamnosi TaxID=3096156 RepID=UPI002FC61020
MAKMRAMQMVAVAVLCGTATLAGAVAMLGTPARPVIAQAPAPAVPAPAAPVAAAPVAAAPVAAAPVAAAVSKPVASPAAPAPVPTPAPDPGYVVKRILDVKSPFVHGDYYWDTAGVPDGPIVVTVDLAAQVLSVFRGGYEIGTAVMVYGADEKPTPLGVFAVSQKDATHVSNLYDAPMPYMLRLTNDGISIHGSPVGSNLATHGCVGVPKPFAKLLFGVVKLGDRVIVSRGETLSLGDQVKAAS